MGCQSGDEARRPVARMRVLSSRILGVAISGLAMIMDPTNSAAFEPSSAFGQDWNLLALLKRGEQIPSALAQQAAAGRFAQADSEGVSVLRGGRRDRAALSGVSGLAFDREGTLWIGTVSGLYRWEVDGRPERRPLRGGASANRILRIATSESGMLVGTGAGAFWSTSGRIFQFFTMDGAARPASFVALERPLEQANGEGAGDAKTASIKRCWVLRARELFELRGFVTDAGFRIVSTRRLTTPRVDEGRKPVDLRVDASGVNLLMVFEEIVARRLVDEDSADHRESGWTIERPVLPPGAHIRRLAWGKDGRIQIATDQGLLEAAGWSGPFLRASPPLGNSPCIDVQQGKEATFVALCRRGIYLQGTAPIARSRADVGRPPEEIHHASAQSFHAIEVDPSLSEIRTRAIQRSGLSVKRADQLRKGLSRRAYWPELSFKIGADIDRDRQTDRDQSFVSGDTRHLLDRTYDRKFGLAASLQFDWDLGGVAYPDDAVNLSRELRLVLSLRDSVSDEINQLYFERQAIRERVSLGGFLDSAEDMRLRLRASEIEAGLDAWTGGWISRWRADRAREKAAHPSESSRNAQIPRRRSP